MVFTLTFSNAVSVFKQLILYLIFNLSIILSSSLFCKIFFFLIGCNILDFIFPFCVLIIFSIGFLLKFKSVEFGDDNNENSSGCLDFI